jgi:hypothetical protein
MRALLFVRRGLVVFVLGVAWLWTIAGAAFSPLLPAGVALVAALLCLIVPADRKSVV